MPCASQRIAFELLGLRVEHLDEQPADDLALLFGIGHTLQAREKRGLGIHADHTRTEVLREHAHDLIAFVQAQQAGVDEHARELIADRRVQQRRHHGRIHAAREPEQHAVLADRRANLVDVLGHDVLCGPRGRAAADLEHEAADDVEAVLRVRDLGMELQPVDLPLHVRHGGERRVAGRADRDEARRQSLHAVAVAHPDLEARAEPRQQRVVAGELHLGVAVLAVRGGLHGAAELLGQRLHAVTDAEHRHALLDERIGDLRRAFFARRTRGRPTG